MILYPPKVRAEIELLADKFFASEEASRLSDDQEVWDELNDKRKPRGDAVKLKKGKKKEL